MNRAKGEVELAGLRRFKPYPEYKDSEAEWLGAIPSHWRDKRIKYVAPISDERVYQPDPNSPYVGLEHIESSTGRYLGNEDGESAESTASKFREGDVLFGKLRPYLAKVLCSQFSGTCSTEFLVLRSSPEIVAKYLWYQLLGRGFIDWISATTYGAKMPRVSPGQISGSEVALPPLDEQRVIAAFLDRQTGKIDALVAKKEELIKLLQEKRTALITHAVTKGLDANAPMKDSGIEWLGEIPAHWDLAKVVYRYEVQLGKMLDQSRITEDNFYPYLRVLDVQWGEINTDNLPLMDFSPRDKEKFRLEGGDLMVNEGGSYVGRSAIWNGEIEDCFYQKALHRLRARSERDNTRFFYYAMQFATRRGVFVAGGNQTTIDHLTVEQLNNYRFPFPPPKEQTAIADYLDLQERELAELIRRIGDAISKQEELRTALISAAVTGKIDVREEAS